jgi:chromosome segregation ATPase
MHAPTLPIRNTLVCDTSDEARRLAYGGGERHKVVSRDGTLFNKAGIITGGASEANDARAQRWNDGALSKCKEQRSELEQRLQVCMSRVSGHCLQTDNLARRSGSIPTFVCLFLYC